MGGGNRVRTATRIQKIFSTAAALHVHQPPQVSSHTATEDRESATAGRQPSDRRARGIPQARETIDDGNGLEQAIAELETHASHPVVRRHAVDQGILVAHVGGDPP